MTSQKRGTSPAHAPRTATGGTQSNNSHNYDDVDPPFPAVPERLTYRFDGGEQSAEERAAHAMHDAAVKIVRAHAQRLANGDPIRTEIYYRTMRYRQAMDTVPSIVDKTGTWWLVGRNASHEFYLGFDAQGRYASGGYGEDLLTEGDPEFLLEEWQSRREWENRWKRRQGDLLGVGNDARLEVVDGRLCRSYYGYRFSSQPIKDPDKPGYLGHY